jgi:hypothetical protein
MVHARTDYNRIQDPEKLIADDEPVMLFRAKDNLAPAILAQYADYLKMFHASQHMIDSVLAQEAKMRQWQRTHGCKLPDMPEDAVPQ